MFYKQRNVMDTIKETNDFLPEEEEVSGSYGLKSSIANSKFLTNAKHMIAKLMATYFLSQAAYAEPVVQPAVYQSNASPKSNYEKLHNNDLKKESKQYMTLDERFNSKNDEPDEVNLGNYDLTDVITSVSVDYNSKNNEKTVGVGTIVPVFDGKAKLSLDAQYNEPENAQSAKAERVTLEVNIPKLAELFGMELSSTLGASYTGIQDQYDNAHRNIAYGGVVKFGGLDFLGIDGLILKGTKIEAKTGPREINTIDNLVGSNTTRTDIRTGTETEKIEDDEKITTNTYGKYDIERVIDESWEIDHIFNGATDGNVFGMGIDAGKWSFGLDNYSVGFMDKKENFNIATITRRIGDSLLTSISYNDLNKEYRLFVKVSLGNKGMKKDYSPSMHVANVPLSANNLLIGKGIVTEEQTRTRTELQKDAYTKLEKTDVEHKPQPPIVEDPVEPVDPNPPGPVDGDTPPGGNPFTGEDIPIDDSYTEESGGGNTEGAQDDGDTPPGGNPFGP